MRKKITWNTKAAEKLAAKNKALIEAGETYRAQKSSDYKLKGKPDRKTQ